MALLVVIIVLAVFLFVVNTVRDQKQKKEYIDFLSTHFGSYPAKDYRYQGRVHRKALLSDTKGIDSITWNDFHMEEIYEMIDRCFTSAGEEVLYHRLHMEEIEDDKSALFHRLISKMESDASLRQKTILLLNELGIIKSASPFDVLNHIATKNWGSSAICILLDLLFVPAICLLYFAPLWGGLFLFILIIANILRYFKYRSAYEGYLKCLVFYIKLQKLIVDLSAMFDVEMNCVRQDMLTKAKQLKRISKHTRLLLSFGASSGVKSGMGPIEMIFSYINMVFHFDLMEFRLLIKSFAKERDALYDMLYFVGLLDSSISVAHFRQMVPYYVEPQFIDTTKSRKVSIVDGIHPLLKNAVPNTIDEDTGIILTGSNASGKSTFLRMVGLNVILAQTIYTALCREYVASRFQVYSALSISDNLLNGDSYFMAEIKAIKRIWDAVEKMNDSGQEQYTILCFVDEILKGTNTVERISAGQAILQGYSMRGVLCFAATHDLELTSLLENQYHNYHFEEDLAEDSTEPDSATNKGIHFSYILKKGPSTSRNAIKLLAQMGYPLALIQSAEELALQLDGRLS